MGMDSTFEQHKKKRYEQNGYYISQFVSALIQALLLSQALFLVIAGHDANFDESGKISTFHCAFIIPAVLFLTAFILFARYKKLRVVNRLTFHAWLIYATTLAAMTPQASVVLGVFLITVAVAFYTRRGEIGYLPFYVYFIVMFTALILRDGNELPFYLQSLPNFPIVFDETIISLMIHLPIMSIALAWRELDRSVKRPAPLSERIPLHVYRILLVVFLLFHVIAQGWHLALRIRVFASSTYDMGIFTQMYHYMSRTGLPLTTLERDMLLSHFKVHLSPILYALLPLFKLFPSTWTIQMAQVFLTASGIIPVYLMTKQYGLGKKARLVWTSLYLLLPGIFFGSFYDFHENVFLAPILLFLVYFSAKGSLAGTAVFTLLALMVKEDAFLYVAAVALSLLFGSKDRKMTTFARKKATALAIGMFVVGAIWFTTALIYLANHGMGAMTSRLNNLIGIPKLGLLSVIPTVFLNLTLFMETIFVKSKMGYIMIAMTSLGFIPLLNRKFHRLFLWIPFIAINLMSNYEYQYCVDFQYNYGSHALLFVLALLTYADYVKELQGKRQMPRHGTACIRNPSLTKQRTPLLNSYPRIHTSLKRTAVSSLLLLALVASSVQTTLILKKQMKPLNRIARQYAPSYTETLALLDRIPRDSIVVADGLLTVHLADIEQLYDAIYYDWEKDRPLPDYIVLRRGAMYYYEHYDTMLLSGFREVEDMSSAWLLVMKRDH